MPFGLSFDFFEDHGDRTGNLGTCDVVRVGSSLTSTWSIVLWLIDGLIPSIGVVAPFRPVPFSKNFGPLMIDTLPGYKEQDASAPVSEMCPYFQSVSEDLLSIEEKAIAC